MNAPATPPFLDDNPIPQSWTERDNPAEAPALAELESARQELITALETCAVDEIKVIRKRLDEVKAQIELVQAGALSDQTRALERGEAAIEPDSKGRLACVACGELMKENSKPHETIARVVRPFNRYGAGPTSSAGPGEIVYIEPRHLVGAARAATMSLAEYAAKQAKDKPQAEKPKPMLLQMVERGAKAMLDQTREIIRRGKERERTEAEKAAAKL